jgi:hypothetical protein
MQGVEVPDMDRVVTSTRIKPNLRRKNDVLRLPTLAILALDDVLYIGITLSFMSSSISGQTLEHCMYNISRD